MKHKFFGNEVDGLKPVNKDFANIEDIRELYDLMSNVWCEYSCAPRMRKDWSKNNMTLGQCSITSFLIQDIYGGEVYGVPLKEGGYHCFNIVNGKMFDLTSEQFGEVKLIYTLDYPQSREEHFASEEKYQRYLYIKVKLRDLLVKK